MKDFQAFKKDRRMILIIWFQCRTRNSFLTDCRMGI